MISLKEYNNICTLLNYLREQLHTPLGDKYYHGSYNTCSIGFAAISGKFPSLPMTVEYYESGLWNLKYKGNAENHSRAVFGDDYTRHVALPYNDVIMGRPEGKKQLAYVIEKIENLLIANDYAVPAATPVKGVKVPKVKQPKAPNLATAGKRIEARIARMQKVKADIAKLGVDAKHFTVNVQSMDAHIAALRDALAS